MTLATPLSSVTYQGNGATTSFPFSFPVLSAAHLVVTLTDTTQSPAIVTALSASQYGVAGIGSPSGGTVSLSAGLAVGTSLTIRRVVPYAQTTSIVNQGGFYPDVLESALDYLTMEVQQLAEQSSRTVLVPVGSGLDPASYLTIVQTASTNAGNSATSAAGSAATATTQAAAAGIAATNAATSATAAAGSAATATAQAAAAGIAATNAATSATNAANSAASATGSAATATTQAAAAGTSATNAATSATAAAGSATTATTQAAAAGTAATNAAASATAAQNYVATLTGTSATSLTVGTGAQALTVGTGLNLVVGQWVTLANTPAPANYLHGQVTAYNSGTGALTVNVTDTGGAGSFAAWTLSLSGTRGATGAQGPAGATFTESTLAGNTNLTSAQTGFNYTATAALTLTVAQTTTLASTWTNTVFALGGNVTVTINAADKINGGTTGAGAVIPKGFFGTLTTDANGALYLELGQAVLGSTTLASAATVDLGSSASATVSVTGTTAITSFGASAQAGVIYTVIFGGALTLTYNAASLILPTGANLTTAAGDVAQFLALGGGNFRCIDYTTANGQALATTPSIDLTVRQTVLSGDTNFLTVGSGLTPAFTATKPLVLTFANGFGGGGAVDYVSQLTAGTSLSAIAASNTSFLYAAYVSASSVTWGSTLVPPQYGASFDPQGFGLYHFENVLTDDYGNSAAAAVGSPGTIANTGAKFGTYCLKYTGAALANFWKIYGFKNTPPMTVEGWFQAGALATNQGVINFSMDNNNTNAGYTGAINLTSGNKLALYLSASTAGDIANNVNGVTTVTSGWHHLAFTWDGSNYRVFLDGVLDICVTTTTQFTYPGATAGQPVLMLGGGNSISPGYASTNSLYDEWRVSPCVRYATASTATGTSVFTPPAAAFVADGDFFSTATMTMSSITGAGPSFGPALNRVYVGEAVAGASTIASVIAYAVQGQYVSAWTATVPTATTISFSPNMGTPAFDAVFEIKNLTPEYGFAPGDVVSNPNCNRTGITPQPSLYKRRNSVALYNDTAWEVTASPNEQNITPANWAYRIRTKRSF